MGLDPVYGEDRIPEWTYWTRSGVSGSSTVYGGGLFYESCQYDDDKWHAQVVVPENVPTEGLFIWVEMREVGDIPNVRSAMIKPDEPEPDVGTNRYSIPRELVIMLILLVVVVIVAIIVLKRQGKEDQRG